MATLTTRAATNSGRLVSFNAVYATARDGGGSFATSAGTTPASDKVGQDFDGSLYYCDNAFVEFDTSSIPAGATISSATISVWSYFNDTALDFTLQARLYDYGASLTSADWRNGTNLNAATLLASISTASLPSDDTAYLTLTDVALPANINKGGATRIILCSSRQPGSGTAPTATKEQFYLYIVDATKGVKLDVTYTVSTTTRVSRDPFGMSGFFGM